MPNTNNVKVTAGKETVANTPVTTTHVLPIKGLPSINRAIETKADPVIVGRGMVNGKYAVAANVKGSLPLAPRSCGGMGLLLKSTLGSEATPAQVCAIIRLRYTGSSVSAKITTDNGAKTINSKLGALGAEANDATFGTTGTISLTNIAFDTVAELVAAIEAYADYECKLITGDPSATILSVVAGTFQAKGKWVVLVLTGSTSGAYAHQFTPDFSTAERPTLSIQKDGYQDNYKYGGCAVPMLSFSAALKGEVDGNVDILGMSELIGQSVSGLTLPDAQPFIFGQGITSLGGVDYNYVRSASVKLDIAHREDGYGQASLDRAYHQKDMFAASGDLTLRLDSVSVLERPKVEAGTRLSVLLVYFGASSKVIGGLVRECMIVEIAFALLDSFEESENSGALDAKLAFTGVLPGGTIYDPAVTVTLLTTDSAAY
jgi:hypothetical protein